MKYLKTFVGAVLAGITIGIGGVAYLSLENKVAGAVLFTVGLYTIVVHGLNLFTGKVGYLPYQKASYLIDLAVIWFGNLVGTGMTAAAVQMSRIQGIGETASKICAVKEQDHVLSLFLLGIFCGMLMYIAVEGYKRVQNPLILVAGVAAFILCGFEHCVADMFYFSLAGAWNMDMIFKLLVITLGNSVGGVLLPLFQKIPQE